MLLFYNYLKAIRVPLALVVLLQVLLGPCSYPPYFNCVPSLLCPRSFSGCIFAGGINSSSGGSPLFTMADGHWRINTPASFLLCDWNEADVLFAASSRFPAKLHPVAHWKMASLRHLVPDTFCPRLTLHLPYHVSWGHLSGEFFPVSSPPRFCFWGSPNEDNFPGV